MMVWSLAASQGLYKDGPTGRAGVARLELDIDSTRKLAGAAARE